MWPHTRPGTHTHTHPPWSDSSFCLYLVLFGCHDHEYNEWCSYVDNTLLLVMEGERGALMGQIRKSRQTGMPSKSMVGTTDKSEDNILFEYIFYVLFSERSK